MQTTTRNVFDQSYNEDNLFYIGSHTGFLKGISVHGRNTNKVTLLCPKKESSKEYIKSLEFKNDLQNEIVIGRQNGNVDVYSVETNSVISSFDSNEHSPVVGVASYDNGIVAGLGSGNIKLFNDTNPVTLTAGTDMCRLTQCKADRSLIATGGKDDKNIIRLFDLYTLKQKFIGKNVPDDYLNIKVRIWENDVKFLTSHIIATCSRTGYIRIYDTRKQRRPVLVYSTEEKSFSCLEAYDTNIYVGTTVGGLFALDSRKMKNIMHTYKGFFGGLNDLRVSVNGQFIVSGSMDRYIRVHDTQSCVKLFQQYVLSKVSTVLFKELENKTRNGYENEPLADSEDRNVSEREYDELFEKMPKIGAGLDEPLIENKIQSKKRSSFRPETKKKRTKRHL